MNAHIEKQIEEIKERINFWHCTMCSEPKGSVVYKRYKTLFKKYKNKLEGAKIKYPEYFI